MPADTETTDPAKTIASLREAISSSGADIFGDGAPALTPQPFPLSQKQVAEFEKLGHRLFLFLQALDRIRSRSAKGTLPAWIAAALDDTPPAGVPSVFCPDLILTETGWSLVDFSPPTGIVPVTDWLMRTYAPLTGDPIAGLEGPVPSPGATLPAASPSNVPFALLHLRALRDVWRSELRESQFQRLEKAIPYTWLMDPAPLPPQAVIPRLDLPSMRALSDLRPGKRAALILKAPGGATLHGRDATGDTWRAAVTRALDETPAPPHVLQEAVSPAPIDHPVWNPDTESAEPREVTVRLNPAYVTEQKTAVLAGLLATLKCKDTTILAPCSVKQAD